MYTLVLVVATGTVSVLGTYPTAQECRADTTQFKDSNVTVACVRQLDHNEQIERAQKMMLNLMQGLQAQ